MAVPDFESLAQPGIRRLRAYDPGHDIVALRAAFGCALLEMGSNENAWGTSPAALAAFQRCAAYLHRYPDPLGAPLKRALADHLGLSPAQLMLGNGSHELLMMIAQAFAGPGASVVAAQFGFAVYALAAQAAGAEFAQAPALPMRSAMSRGHDLAALAAAITTTTRLVYIANPNNPTGTWIPSGQLDAFLAALPAGVLAVVDEAYIEYSTEAALCSAVSLLERHANLIVTRTFSKAHGLAGLRVGYACAHPELLRVLERLRESFNVNSAGLAACAASLADSAHLLQVRENNALERTWLAGQLRGLGFAVAPSQTNFLLADTGRDASALEAALVGRGIVLRPMAGYGLRDCLRITVGTRRDNELLVAALTQA